jgi:hypothetical protein
MEQLDPAARLVPQLLELMKKSVALVPLIAMLRIVRVAVPEFLMVIVWALVVVKSTVTANVSEDGARPTPGAVPVPLKAAVCGLPLALSLTLTLADLLPLAVGLKVTLMVHVPFAARVDGLNGQLLACAKSPAFVPAIAILLMVSAALPLFVNVIA